MVKKQISYYFILFSFCLFSFVIADADWVKYDYSKMSAEKSISSGDKRHTFALEFPEEGKQIPYYVKVEVTSTDSNNAPLLCFSSTDQNCYDREQLVKNPNGKSVVMWLKREQFEKEDQELYALVECENAGCSYTIKFTGDQVASFSPNMVYSYRVTQYNRDMRFEIVGEVKEAYITIALEGSTKATLTVENVFDEGVTEKNIKILTFYRSESDYDMSPTRVASIIIRGAEADEYLTLSAHIVKTPIAFLGVAEEGYVEPNGPEITGYLEQNKIQEECFPIDFSNKYSKMSKLYITGRIHTKYAWFYLEDENQNFLPETDNEILDGQLSFLLTNNGKLNYMCFELPNESTFTQYKMAFTFSLTDPSNLPNLYNYYPPQITGKIYRRMLPKGKIAFFSGLKNDNTAKKYDYSLYQKTGLTKMYIAHCRTYPDCNFEESQLSNLIEPESVSQMTIWTTSDDKSSVLSNEKYVIVAFCADQGNNNEAYCEFETSIFSKGQDITLVEDEKFSKYVVSGEKGKIIADLQAGRQIQRLAFDIMVFSGDVTFTIEKENLKNKLGEDAQITYDKYYLSNKIYYHFDLAQLSTDRITLEFTAVLNSFFTIQYEVNSYNKNQLEEYIPSGESYLVQIDPTSVSKTKTIHFSNRFYKNNSPFMANFFALNCEFEVKRGDETIEFFDGYAQEILRSGTSGFDSQFYDYEIKITEPDLSNYNHKMCMIYVAGYEDYESYPSDIIVGENINQQFIFKNNFKKIRFLYPHADANKDLAIHFNVIDKAFYRVTVFANKASIKQGIITRTQTLFYRGTVISNNCGENTLCPIVVQVEYYKEITKTDPMIEVTIREIKNTPTYLQKGQAKVDFVCGDKLYYLYTDIGKNEIGEITINFFREFGYIWGRIVRKDQTSIDEEANWRGIYRMPSKEWEDSLPFNGYTKKLFVNPEDTVDCIEGCYLLISIQVSQIGEYVEDYKFYPFSIITRITPSNRAYTDIPKVVIQVDEFVIGNVDVSDNERIYEFFEVWLPHDSDIVEFDWQSSVAGLYINLGGTRPTTKNADFKLLPPGKDTILTLSKKEIIDKAKSKKIKIPTENSLQDINLVIGIWTDKTDSINTELYSLRVHQPDANSNDQLNIVEVNTDQKILCNPTQLQTNEYRCLFMIIYDNVDVQTFTPLLAYGGSTNHGALSYMYANFISRDIYNEFSTRDLKDNIPTYQTAELNSRSDGVDYIYTSSLKEEQYMFINIMTDKPDPVMLVTSMPIYNYIAYNLFEFYPNPNTEQLLSVPGEELILAFQGTDSIRVNIVALNGNAELSWISDPNTVFSLRGNGDRITLSSGKKIDKLLIRRLILNNNKLTAMEDPGFVFYISYQLIDTSIEIAYDEISYGKSLEISYKDTDLPVVLYSKIGTEYRDINIAITFKDNEIDKGGEFYYAPLYITAQLVKEKTIYQAKKDKELVPSTDRAIQGNYDTALKTAQVFLNQETIRNFNIKETDNPSLYIRIEKYGEFEQKVFDKFSVEAQVSGVNDGVIPVEKVYHYGRVRNGVWQQTLYRLKADKKRPYMRIQIAFNSENLDFVVSDDENNRRSNITYFKSQQVRGKVIITIDNTEQKKELFYLYIYKKSRTSAELYLNNYAFKYFNGKTLDDLYEYRIVNSPEINITETKEEEEDVITCTFNKIDLPQGSANITYFFKVVENKTHYYGESCNTIAVTESPYYTIYERNPKDVQDKITLTARGYLSNWVYLNVIAQIQQNDILEYVSYNGKISVRPSPENKDDDNDKKDDNNKKDNNNSNYSQDNTSLFIIIGVILAIIVVGLVVTIIIFQQRNKNLLNQVKHVSFQQTNTNTDPNLLLQKQGNPQ